MNKNRWKLNYEECHEKTWSWNKTQDYSFIFICYGYISQTSYHKFTIQNGVLLWRHLQQDHMPHITSYYHNAFPYLQSCRWCFIRQVFNINVHIQHFFNNLLEFGSLYSSQILLHLIEWKNDITDIVMVPLIL